MTGLSELKESPSLREQVSQALRFAVMSGEMAEGEVYSAPSLALKLGVSATPVREALLDLAAEGLVFVVKNKGFQVTRLDDAALDEIADIREMLEVPTVGRVAALGVPAAAKRQLSSAAKDIEEAAERADLIGYLQADMRFHQLLLSLAGNRRLVEAVSSLRRQTRLAGLRDLANAGRLEESAAEHAALLAVVASGDVSKAEESMRQHLRHVRGSWAGLAE